MIALSSSCSGGRSSRSGWRLSNITGPLLFLVAGLLLGNPNWGIVTVDVQSSTVHTLAELTLALLLFADASTSHSWRPAATCR